MRYIILFIFSVIFHIASFANNKVEMATGLRSSGKIYVVVLVLLTIFLGISVFLFILDKKISKLEKNENSNSELESKI